MNDDEVITKWEKNLVSYVITAPIYTVDRRVFPSLLQTRQPTFSSSKTISMISPRWCPAGSLRRSGHRSITAHTIVMQIRGELSWADTTEESGFYHRNLWMFRAIQPIGWRYQIHRRRDNMDDLINRDAAIDIMQAKGDAALGTPKVVFYSAANMLKMMPAVDAEPVRYGKWMTASGMLPPEYHGRKYCSACSQFALHDRFGRERLSWYCPNCGVKMDMDMERDDK